MMAEFDDLAAEIIADLSADFLKSITLRKVTPGAFNPSTGATAADTITDSTVKAQIQQFDLTMQQNPNVEIGDFIVEVFSSTLLDLNDKLVIDTVVHDMIAVIDKPYAVDNMFSQRVQVRAT
jgi:hypothetical protein